jgi:DNA-binding transcriptional LysR family regulator
MLSFRNGKECAAMDTLASMRAFAKVAEAKNFSRAAKALKISPAMVTKHVQNLEQRIGTRLVNRSTRQLSLTEAGAAYYERCVHLLADIGEAERAAGSLGAQPRGRLRMTAPMYFAPSELRPIVQGFIEQYPEISVDVLVTNRRVDLVEDGLDLAVRIAARALEPSLIARRLASSRLVACASPAYLRRAGTPAQPADLRAHRCLTTTLFKLDEGWVFRRGGRSETVKPQTALQSNNNELLCEAAADGFGITIQPTINIWRALASGRLTTLLDKWSIGELGVFVVYPSRKFLPAKTRLFIDFLTARFPRGPQHDVWMERARLL